MWIILNVQNYTAPLTISAHWSGTHFYVPLLKGLIAEIFPSETQEKETQIVY